MAARSSKRAGPLTGDNQMSGSGNMQYVYFLQSVPTAKIYVGMTSDIKMRLLTHNAGGVVSTKPYGPWELVYYEAHKTKLLARKAELFYKTGQGRRQVKRKLGLIE